MISLFQTCVLLALAANLLLGAGVFFTNARRMANRVFLALSVGLAVWLTCMLVGAGATTEAALSFWIRQSCAASVTVPLLASMLRIAIERPDAGAGAILRASAIWLFCALGTAALCQAGPFLVGSQLPAQPGDLGTPVYGPLFAVFAGYWFVSTGALLAIFRRALGRTDGVRRLELQFMALASVAGIVPGVVLVIIVPTLTGSMRAAVFAPVSVVIWHSTIAYGIATRRIMGVAEFLRRAATTLLLSGFLAALYLLVVRTVVVLPFRSPEDGRTVSHVVAALVVTLSLTPASAFLRRRAQRLFAADREAVAELLRGGSHLTSSITTIGALLDGFGQLLHKTLELESLRIYLRADDLYALRYGQGGSPTVDTFPVLDPLVGALRQARRPLVRDVTWRSGGDPIQAAAERRLVHVGAEAAVPVRSKGELDGFLLLGRRATGRVLDAREADVLGVLGDQLGIAIENALLYTRLQDAKVYNDVLLENLVTGVVAADAEGRLTVCNREAQRILGLTAPAVAPGRPVEAVLPDVLAQALRQTLATASGVRDAAATLRQQAPVALPIRYGTAVLTGSADRPMGVLLVVQDVSRLRQLEEQVRRSDRLASIGTLAAGMAHEIKNPLVSLKTFAQLLPERYDDPEFRATFTPLLGAEVGRIDAVVTQLLGFARPVKPNLLPTSVHAVIETALQLVAQQFKRKGLVLVRQCHAEADGVLGDEHLLGQVFVNLLLNGMDATPPGGTLTVATRIVERPPGAWRAGPEASEWLEVQVRDTGTGIAPEDRAHIFDPFFTTKPNGTGLGLSVAHGIVWDHLGCIEVESEPGQGACFRVSLPLLRRSTP